MRPIDYTLEENKIFAPIIKLIYIHNQRCKKKLLDSQAAASESEPCLALDC